ncbi:Tetratricopeptide TPR_1 repeat-containing protein [Bacteroides coprosuis DSM 18011]|uniref:Tetratricopeptide TPR_1 repeat-containing protein n=1 Tax=Bacteroides coprosuis DSM 18011 TaxID=679937 RepID=F3ZU42_9BACE|nr:MULTISPECIES: tetratricopeptide repeat protein [Bacteroides]EGJ71143.1 Tetratricopeptide TPR_1 repeat-containing protein [Bacteroides coprosuis DSM 18011]
MTKHKNEKGQLNVEEALTTSEAFLVKNKKNLIGGLIAIIVIIAGVLIYKNIYAGPKEKNAQEAIFLGEEYFNQGQFEMALNGDSISFDGLIKVADQYSGTKSGNLANYYIGISFQKLGQFENAIKYLEKFNAKDKMLYPASLLALGNCYVEVDKIDKAISTLEKAASLADNNTISPMALRQAGILLEKTGKYKEALTNYTKIKDSYFNSPISVDIDKYIERAKAQIN